MDVDVTEEDVAAAGQISQADIIERQAETITQLQRQVQRGTEYKQLTKTKLKEAAARLREYRLRVEALLKEVEEAREALKREKTLHTKTKKTATLNRRPKGRDVAVQTDVRRTIARQTQTQVDYVKTRRTISCGVQTETVAASRKRSRENDGQDGGDQLVPRLSRDSDAELLPVQSTAKGEMDVAPMEMWKPQALQMDGLTAMQFSQETSAALDAELASSDSEGGDDQMMIDMTTELVVTDKENGADLTELPLLDPDVSIAIDKELESSGEEEECRKAADENTGGVGKKRRLDEADNENKSGVEITGSQTALPLLDPGVSNDIDKELESSSEEGDDRSSTGGSAGAVSKERQVGKEDRAIKSEMNNSGLPLLDPGVSNEIDKELESSSEEEENAEHIGEGRGVMNIGRQQHQTTASTKTGVENNGNKVVLSALDPGVSNEIDKDLDSSGDEKQDGKAGESTDTVCKEVQQNREDGASEAGVDGADALQNKRVLVSIDDELDDEFATLDSDPEPEHQEEKVTVGEQEAENSSSSSSSSSSDSDSSDSSSDAGGNDFTVETLQTDLISKGTPTGDTNCVTTEDNLVSSVPADTTIESGDDTNNSTGTTAEQRTVTSPTHPCVEDGEQVALPNDEIVVVTTPIEKKPVTATSNNSPKRVASMPPRQQSSTTAANAHNEDSNADEHSLQRHGIPEMSAESLPGNLPSYSNEVGVAHVVGDVHTSSEGKSPTKLSLITNENVIGRPRKAGEAIPEGAEVIARKKIKLSDDLSQAEDGEELVHVNVDTDSNETTNKNGGLAPNDNGKLQLKKSLASFKRGIILSKNEVNDNAYSRRTFDFLVKHSSKFIDSDRDHVMVLCQTLAIAYRKLDISPIMVLRAALSVFRSPRLRRLIPGNESLGVSWLSHQVMMELVNQSGGPIEQDVAILPGSLSSLSECLLYLRGLLIYGQSNIGECLPETKVQIVVTEQKPHRFDKAFLAQICALHTRLCQSMGQLVCSRVLLFDLLRENPDIRGLYFAMIMLELYPAILERELDPQCAEREMLLKATILQSLTAIASTAASNQELLLRQSSTSMLHRISDAIQMPELMHVECYGANFKTAFLEKLFKELQGLGGDTEETLMAPNTSDHFQLAKSLELCTAVYGVDLVAQVFSVDRCQALFSSADINAYYSVVAVTAHIAMAAAASNGKGDKLDYHSQQYVESVINWLCQLLSVEQIDETTSDDRFDLQQHCAVLCVKLILEYAAEEGLGTRRRALYDVINWFDTVPSERLLDLPAVLLRELRLAVVAARPHQC